ncbi:tyrosine-protein phosphatase [Dietzia sp. CH92]|uniref:tyrosine-protein phosphatase n=1 Tax=Dietzia sp. CH92 TaxID=3051823 RepID=UPI0028D092D3|nr:tyrosine-protein phosphatase [Dietzia sp. CH92]
MTVPSLTSPPPAQLATANFRDVARPAGVVPLIAPGRLFRSASPHEMPAAGVDHIRRLGIRTVIDLRSEVETAARPSVFPAPQVELVHVPLELMGAAESHRTELTLDALYSRMLVERADGLMRAVRAVARAPRGGVLVHCTAGKDRTGLTVALILSVLGAPMDTIVDDYAMTESLLAGPWTDSMVAALTAAGMRIDERLLQILAGSPAEVLATAFAAHVLAPWGDAAAYLLAHGLAAEELTALRDRFLLSPSPFPAAASRPVTPSEKGAP